MSTNSTRAVAATRTSEFDHPSAAWSLADDISDRIAIAGPAELHDIHRDMWVQHAHGKLSVEETEVLSEAYRTRLEAIQEHRQAAQPGPDRRPGNAPRAPARRPQRSREKLFGDGRPVPLDREAKNRIKVLAKALTRRTEPGKHYGAIKVIRTSNSYRFIDPGSKSEFPSGTKNQDHLS